MKNSKAITKTAKKKNIWEVIGHIAVDAGMLWISDPCRIFGRTHWGTPCADRKLIFDDWSDFLEKIGMSEESQVKLAQRIVRIEEARRTGQPMPVPTQERVDETPLPQVVSFELPGVSAHSASPSLPASAMGTMRSKVSGMATA